MSKFRNPSYFSRFTPLVMIISSLKKLGLAGQFFKFISSGLLSDEIKAKVFEGYQPAAHDVFATTYTKAGTNWSLQGIEQIAWRGEAEFDHIHSVAPWPEAPFQGIIPLSDGSRYRASPTGLRVIKSGAKAGYIPYSKKATYISVIRDPKEVFVSSFHFIPKVFSLGGAFSVEEWLEWFLSLQFPSGSWAEHTASFWSWRNRPNVLVLFFSEIVQNPRGSIQRIADTMKVELTEVQLDKVQERCSLGYMKAHEDQFCPPLLPFVPKKKRAVMIREGRTGNSGELLSPAQQERIDQHMLAELKRLGSDFPYAEKFMSK
uniref:Sulfotransferase domain-containing protein n=1 Tax=Candidatus Kentrum sp. FW TaxID=2126338 RepID=A0A450SMZ7_9GAMM|nr:MAG: Sulfotransferase domain-containing protein [Candidatus Kentron sp. FW]VFJ66241.1 MAG: Sulfotransferase domain-containing protein [Candidatus Kentron sp. FW]